MAKKGGSPYKYVGWLIVIFAVVIALRLTIVTGAKILKDMHPWDYIAIIILFIIFAAVLYVFRSRKK